MSEQNGDCERPTVTLRKKALMILSVILLFTGVVLAVLFSVPALVSSGLLAYSFGLRHAVDADHIAAIDNVTRRLTRPGRSPPASVGFFFALGHSLVVTIMCLIVAVASSFMETHLDTFAKLGAILGASISGSFLLVIGIINLWIAVQLRQAWREQSQYGGHTHPLVGMCTRCCPSLFEGIQYPWQMLPVGFLFGLGFDTSSEIGLLGIVAMSNAGVERFTIMILPLLFMGGMCLVDTLNGVLMAWAYGRALEDTMQRLYYNLFLTTTSGLIAVAVGVVEVLGAIALGAGLGGWFWDAVGSINDNFEILGYVVIGIFVTSMAVALGCFHRVFPGGRPLPDPARANLLRYLDSGNFIDRSGV